MDQKGKRGECRIGTASKSGNVLFKSFEETGAAVLEVWLSVLCTNLSIFAFKADNFLQNLKICWIIPSLFYLGKFSSEYFFFIVTKIGVVSVSEFAIITDNLIFSKHFFQEDEEEILKSKNLSLKKS